MVRNNAARRRTRSERPPLVPTSDGSGFYQLESASDRINRGLHERPANRARGKQRPEALPSIKLLGGLSLGFIACVFLALSLSRLSFELPTLPSISLFSAEPEASAPSASMSFASTAGSSSFSLPPLPRSEDVFIGHRVRRGETLGSIFARYGLEAKDATEVAKAIEQLRKEDDQVPAVLRKGRDLDIGLSENGQFQFLRASLGLLGVLKIEADASESLLGRVVGLPRQERERVSVGVIESSFASAAIKAGMNYDIVDDLVDLFANNISFTRDFRKGDRFSVIYRAHELSDGTVIGSGTILAAAIETGDKEYLAIRYVGSDGKARYFNEKGELIGSSFLRYPLKFSRISSHFSHSRLHPVLKRRRPHHGVDFAAPTGTPVRSVADGVVVFAGRKGPNGNYVKIRHGENYMTGYLHLHRIGKGIRRGTKVTRGQKIGSVGSTGRSTGPHLDYRFWKRGKAVNPLTVKLPTVESLKRGTKIGPRYLQRVRYTLDHYQTVNLADFYSVLMEEANTKGDSPAQSS